METFNEFDQQGIAPQRNFSDIISHAFNTYGRVIGWSLLLFFLIIVASMIFSMISGPITGYDPIAANEEMRELSRSGDFMNIYKSMFNIPGYKESIGLSYVFTLLTYPVYAGFLYLMQRGNFKQSVNFNGLFIGFRQNALQYIIYGLISGIAMSVGLMLCVIPMFFILPLFFLGMPIILFENKSAINAIQKSFRVAKENYGTLLGVSFISLLIGIGGIILCGIGVILTIPFYFAAMYSAYCAFCGTPRQIN